ncbi:MAG: TlpA family protein disulfide reductase [Brevundimonas sp.]|uniref:TlpA family protein disulfide reductase n=1 Tax=Brevundimonas sp. TaxID=1871086 RepID=UPI0040333207
MAYEDEGFEIPLIPPAPQPSAESSLSRFAVGAMAKLQTPAEVVTATDYRFLDAAGADIGFDAFKGRVVVVNLWAMWCAPCREEMPTLAALAAAYAGNDQVVVAPVSVDLPDQVPDARAFIADHAPLPFYNDPKFRLPFEFAGKGAMPQTIVLDRQGRVRAHLTGGADWSGPEARALIDALLAEPT